MSRLGVTFSALLVVTALVAPGAGAHDGVTTAPGQAHDVNTPAGHQAEDTVVHSAATEAVLDNGTRLRSAWASLATAEVVAADAGQVGEWGPVAPWPVVGIHVALLPNGKVLAFDTVGDAATETFPVHNFTRATIYDPITGTHTPGNGRSGSQHFLRRFRAPLRRFVVHRGRQQERATPGHRPDASVQPCDQRLEPRSQYGGRPLVSVRDTADERRDADHGRRSRYSGGSEDRWDAADTEHCCAQPAALSLDGRCARWSRLLLGAKSDDAQARPHGRRRVADLRPARRESTASYGSHAVYDIGKTLVAGGGTSSSSALVIDTNGATPQVSATSPMAFGRRQHNLTLLADGSVLATGGNSTGASLIDMNGGVYNAERWDPATGQWTTLAAQAVTRQYHSTALLLPDGRVLSSGGGICGTCDQVGYLAKNAEVFTPPYLFKNDGSGQLAPRPQITSAPGSVSHGASFQISTPNAASISKVGLIRLGSQTHSVEMEQRYLPLSFTAGAGTLTASVPANVHTAVPGIYMLFIVDSAGVPSVASMVGLAPRLRRRAATATSRRRPPPTATASGLAAAYSFNEGIGASAADSSGNDNTGASRKRDLDHDGKYGNALILNGVARVTVNDAPSLDLTTAMTLEAWVFPTTGGSGGT